VRSKYQLVNVFHPGLSFLPPPSRGAQLAVGGIYHPEAGLQSRDQLMTAPPPPVSPRHFTLLIVTGKHIQ